MAIVPNPISVEAAALRAGEAIGEWMLAPASVLAARSPAAPCCMRSPDSPNMSGLSGLEVFSEGRMQLVLIRKEEIRFGQTGVL